MATVEEDLLDPRAGWREDANGVKFTRVYAVKELTSGPNIFGQARQLLKPFAIKDDIYNLFVSNVQVIPWLKSKTEVRGIIEFSSLDNWFNATLDQPIVSFYGTTRAVETQKNYDGTKIIVKYEPGVSGGPPSGPGAMTQIGSLEDTKAYGVLTFEFSTMNSPQVDPTPLAGYLNKVSSAPWRGEPKYAWKCIDMQIDKIKYHPGYHVRAAFELDEETHVKYVAYRNVLGIVPEDIDDFPPISQRKFGEKKNGWTAPDRGLLADFNQIGFPSVFPT